MKIKRTFLLFANIIILVILITSCNKQEENAMNSLDFDEVIIEYQNSQGEKEDVSLIDETVLTEIFKAYDSIIANETSEPMGYPRFLIKFQKDGFSVADWSIDGNQVTSSSQFGRGNRKITNSEIIYDSIYKEFRLEKLLG